MKQPENGSVATPTEPSGGAMLARMLLSAIIGGVLFLVLWAGLNFGFGTALDGPIGAFIMERPCQNLAHTREKLTGYSLGHAGGGGWRNSPSVCHFGPRKVIVAGQIDGLGFTPREGLLVFGGLAGYCVCFVVAAFVAMRLVRSAWQLKRAANQS